MTAQAHLATFGISMEVAQDFIMSNMDNLGEVFRVAEQFKVSNVMIAEIVQSKFEQTITATDVENYFTVNGQPGYALNFQEDVYTNTGTINNTLDSVIQNINDTYFSTTSMGSFTTELIAGKTLYNVYKDDDAQNPEIVDFTFSYDGTVQVVESNKDAFLGNYSIDSDGVLYLTLHDGTHPSYIAYGYDSDTLNAFNVDWSETSPEIALTRGNLGEYFAWDQATAQQIADLLIV